MSPSGRRLTSNHRPKHFSPTTHSSPPYHHQNLRTPSEHVHRSRLQSQWQRASSNQTLEGALHQSPPRVPSPPQELDQVLVQDWDEEAEADEATTEEEELIRVQQEIERL
jgi:hypothetical protein